MHIWPVSLTSLPFLSFSSQWIWQQCLLCVLFLLTTQIQPLGLQPELEYIFRHYFHMNVFHFERKRCFSYCNWQQLWPCLKDYTPKHSMSELWAPFCYNGIWVCFLFVLVRVIVASSIVAVEKYKPLTLDCAAAQRLYYYFACAACYESLRSLEGLRMNIL